MRRAFSAFAGKTAAAAGHWLAFGLALLLIVGWAVSGPFLGFSSLWQLTVNTATTIVTFLLVFLIQHTQNKDAKAAALKQDEIIRAIADARNAFIGLEDRTDDDLEEIAREAKEAG